MASGRFCHLPLKSKLYSCSNGCERMKKISNPFPKILMRLQGIKYGCGCHFFGIPIIARTGAGRITFGKGVVVNSSFLSNLVGLYQRTIIVAKKNGEIHIGDHVGISGATIYSWEKITIGDYTRIGANVKIIDTDFHPVDPTERLNGNNTAAKTSPIQIGKNVFIGMNSIILKGTVIGDNCVVGAGAVVVGRYESNSVIVGNPASVIKRL